MTDPEIIRQISWLMFATLALIQPTDALALKCPQSNVHVFPEDGQLPTGAQITIFGSGEIAFRLVDIERRRPRLESLQTTIPLELKWRDVGQREVTVVLEPSEPVALDALYVLMIDGVDESTIDEHQVILFRGVETSSISRTEWLGRPEYIGSEELFGFGARFRLPVKSTSWILVELHLWWNSVDLGVYRRPLYDERVSFGNNGCSGDLDLRPLATYRVRFSVVDGYGNSTPAPGGDLIFQMRRRAYQ
ncbi:MAG: hypothetical protein HY791_10320 [Deltaproteobacteria bacterium]|nr:hypothetical protein [Deltaproteobacteria bacterium]